MKTAIWIAALVLALVIAVPWAVDAWVLKLYRMPGSAMEPTLKCARTPGCTGEYSDRFAVLRAAYAVRAPARGDVVAYTLPEHAVSRCGFFGGTHVHRIVGLPGETVRIRSGAVEIDGKTIREPYLRRRGTATAPPQRLRAGEYYVLGDNRPHSCDSHVWGPVARRDLIGPIVFRYWPPGRWGEV